MITIDTANMCSHLQKKLFEEDGIYHPLWMALQDDAELMSSRSDIVMLFLKVLFQKSV